MLDINVLMSNVFFNILNLLFNGLYHLYYNRLYMQIQVKTSVTRVLFGLGTGPEACMYGVKGHQVRV